MYSNIAGPSTSVASIDRQKSVAQVLISAPQFSSHHEAALFWERFGFEVVPRDPRNRLTPANWDGSPELLSANKIDAYWSSNPTHEVAVDLGDNIVVLCSRNAETDDALFAILGRVNLGSNMIVQSDEYCYYFFRRAKGACVEADVCSRETKVTHIGVLCGLYSLSLPPTHDLMIEALFAAHASELVVISQEVIDAIVEHNATAEPDPIDKEMVN